MKMRSISRSSPGIEGADIEIPDTLANFQRHITLAEMILAWARSEGMLGAGGTPLVANSPPAAFALARDLAHLMDDMATRQVPWNRLDGLVPEDLDEYWQKTLAFLKIARDNWPKFLSENNLLEPAVRQNRLIAAEAARLKQSGAPVIAAGSTGSIPATAELLDTIAKLPNGAVVLPGLDTDLDNTWWACASERKSCRPQPSSIRNGYPAPPFRHRTQRRGPPCAGGQAAICWCRKPCAQPSKPTTGTRGLRRIAPRIGPAMKDIAVIEAANAEEEALAIAVALREAVEDKNTTAALITPDRALARRVLAALARWDITPTIRRSGSCRDASRGIRAAGGRGSPRRFAAGAPAGTAQTSALQAGPFGYRSA